MWLGKSGMRHYHREFAMYLSDKGYTYIRTLSELPYQQQWGELRDQQNTMLYFSHQGKMAQMDSVITLLIALSPAGDRSQEIQAIQALSHGNRQDEDRMIAELSEASTHPPLSFPMHKGRTPRGSRIPRISFLVMMTSE